MNAGRRARLATGRREETEALQAQFGRIVRQQTMVLCVLLKRFGGSALIAKAEMQGLPPDCRVKMSATLTGMLFEYTDDATEARKEKEKDDAAQAGEKQSNNQQEHQGDGARQGPCEPRP